MLNNDVFNGFLVFAQNETQRAGGGQDEVPIDIYLTSGQKVTLTIPATLQTDDLLEVGVRTVRLDNWQYVCRLNTASPLIIVCRLLIFLFWLSESVQSDTSPK